MDIWHIRAPGGPKNGPIFFSRRTKILPPAKGPKKGPECGRMGVGSKIGRLGASERRNPKFTTPKIWYKQISTMYYFIPKSSSQKVSNPPAPTPVRPKLPKSLGSQKSPYVDLPCAA